MHFLHPRLPVQAKKNVTHRLTLKHALTSKLDIALSIASRCRKNPTLIGVRRGALECLAYPRT